MSATRDQNQKIAFIYSNLYQAYRKAKEVELSKTPQPQHQSQKQVEPEAPKGLTKGAVLRSGDLSDPVFASVNVRPYNPMELIGKRIERPAYLPAENVASQAAIQSLKDNLKKLNDLHSRLRFMLKELEELVKE